MGRFPSKAMVRMRKNPHFDFSHLTPAERIQLARDLWDSVEAEEADWPPSDDERAELDRRLEAARRNPGEGSSWDEVETRVAKILDSVRAKSA